MFDIFRTGSHWDAGARVRNAARRWDPEPVTPATPCDEHRTNGDWAAASRAGRGHRAGRHMLGAAWPGMASPERTVPFYVALRPRTLPRATPAAQRVIAAYQDHLLAELHSIDERSATLAAWRESIVAELRRCRDARGWADMHRRRAPLPGDVDAAPDGTRPISGADLRDAVVRAVYGAARPVTVTEIYRMLCSCGVSPAGNPSRGISDALRAPMAAGMVTRMGRGVYRAGGTP